MTNVLQWLEAARLAASREGRTVADVLAGWRRQSRAGDRRLLVELDTALAVSSRQDAERTYSAGVLASVARAAQDGADAIRPSDEDELVIVS